MRLRQGWRRAFGHTQNHARTLLALFAAFALTACAHHDPTVTGSVPNAATMSPGSTQTIAFESVDGPPRPVFDRLVAALSAEAERRDLPVVTHTVPTTYRVRAYLATYIEKQKKRATLAWTWEVFDTRSSRIYRLAGEEPLGAPKGDVWSQCDDALLKRVAERGLAELATLIGRQPGTTPEPAQPESAPLVASVEGSQAAAFTNPQQ
jgi:hypothetical protein